MIGIWNEATKGVTDALIESLDHFNPVYMMANSGPGQHPADPPAGRDAGPMADPSGRIIDLPIKANFREGLTVLGTIPPTAPARAGRPRCGRPTPAT